MLILITGVPGSGKTLYSIGLIKQWLGEGRQVYADIDGLSLPGVLPAPDDWRECPDGSVVVYDECQQKFGPDGAGRSGRADVQEMEVHRHRGMDILLITQHPKLLHAHIRRLIGRHYHVFRMYGAETAKVFSRDGQIDVDKPSALRDQDSFVWSYPKIDYGAYKSATVHTHKRRLPAWLKRAAIGLIVVIGGTVFLGYQSIGFWKGELPTVTAPGGTDQGTKKEPTDYSWELVQEPAPELTPETVKLVAAAGCAVSLKNKKCKCFDYQSHHIPMDYENCLKTARTNFPFSGIWDDVPDEAVANPAP